MEMHQNLKNIEKAVENKIGGFKSRQEDKEGQPAKQQSPTSPVSPPSASSSPSHEFSFTISVHSSSTKIPDKSKGPPSFAIDLSPADDIFFHGHLLPLHLLSHLPVSPRSSTNSLDSFTLPIGDSIEDQKPNTDKGSCSTSSSSSSSSDIIIDMNSSSQKQSNNSETKGRSKSKSFSLFGLARRRKECEIEEKDDKDKHKKKLRFDVSHVLKRYLRMVKPLMFFRGRREESRFHRQAYSFSGNLSLRNKQELRGRRGEYSAPASMRASPTNSGLLLATTTPASDSTMEELQAAIQAAIAHCKNSVAAEEKLKC
ncbi:BRI1 kinase inhibitor 1-like [Quillaja saponaria]|uniref:BRI1 kinase inhibitor 1-like n=1 Tax=Quillaja saponaria TaxID=32244 RepID=A0AAD7LH77_QUISA|nr:BRI1 kinase inhibitor 1-like [Quillaja saponaria]